MNEKFGFLQVNLPNKPGFWWVYESKIRVFTGQSSQSTWFLAEWEKLHLGLVAI